MTIFALLSPLLVLSGGGALVVVVGRALLLTTEIKLFLRTCHLFR